MGNPPLGNLARPEPRQRKRSGAGHETCVCGLRGRGEGAGFLPALDGDSQNIAGWPARSSPTNSPSKSELFSFYFFNAYHTSTRKNVKNEIFFIFQKMISTAEITSQDATQTFFLHKTMFR